MSSEWRPKDTAKVWYTGIEVVARRSTANEFVCDELVRRCLELIEANSGRRFNVADLVSHLDVSRRTLEKHFLAVTGRSLNDDITAARLRRAQALLSRTSMTQAQIAATCGFADASHMNVVFRRRLGALPSSFRIR